ncbi:MAG: right-handed parallel beta-helix repeat-containing protein, partial [Myxococcales bacterium]|nr:right-handed parallel beta-helix repeat-containing protein [Myxococcales bacterium]
VAAGPLIDRLRERERADLAQLHREYPFRTSYDFGPMVARAETLRSVDLGSFGLFAPAMGDAERRHPKAVLAYVERDDRGTFLELSNALPVPVEVTELRFANAGDGPAPELAEAAGFELPIRLTPTPFQTAPTPVRIDFRPDPGVDDELPDVEGVATVQGQSHRYPFRAVPYVPPLRRSPVPRATLAEALAQHPFLSHDAGSGVLVAEPGTWRVRGSLVLPSGLGLRLPAGTTLRFGPGEGLIATGPLHFAGEAGAPVRLQGPAGDESREPWAGVAVLESERPSHWAHVHVLQTGGFERDGWSIDAGVVFRRADVTMEHCRIAGNRSEDALNVIRSHFVLSDLEIVDSASDALDSDFSEGRIEGGRISRVGGDGIDVSESEVHLSGVHLSEIRDKAVSVGERSRLTASGLEISRSGTAFVSKDRSHGEIRDSQIFEIAHTALMAYVKKAEYGPAELEASGNSITRVQRVALAQTGSRVVIDGRRVPEEDVDVARLYEKGYMRK